MHYDLADINFAQKDIHAVLSGRSAEHLMTLPPGVRPNPLIINETYRGTVLTADEVRSCVDGYGWWSRHPWPEGLEVEALRQLVAGGWVEFTGRGYRSVRDTR